MGFQRPIKGLHFELDGPKITFFTTVGRVLNADTWSISSPSGTRFTDDDPIDISRFIAGCIEFDAIGSNADEITAVLLSPRMAVFLWLEGVALTREHLENAREGFLHVDLPDVNIHGRTVTIRILFALRGGIVPADSNFKPIWRE